MKSNTIRVTGNTMLVLSVLCFVNSFSTLFYRNTFWPFFVLLGILFASLSYIHLRVHINRNNKIVKAFLWGIHILSLLVIISFIIIEGLIITSGNQKDAATPDYVVILGAGLLGDVPSLTLSQRLNESIELLKHIPKSVPVIVSGGQGPGETIAEAEAMKRYLVARGIAADRIFKEDKSTSTSENMIFTMKLIKETDSRESIKITVVTNNFHMFRSKKLAEKTGFKEVQCWSAPISPFLVPTYYIREYLAVVKSVILD